MEKLANIKLTLDQGLAISQDVQADLSSAELARVLGCGKAYLLRRSVDARRKSDVHFVATVGIDGTGELPAPQPVVPLWERPVPDGLSLSHTLQYPSPAPALHASACSPAHGTGGQRGVERNELGVPRPVVVGTGPAGLFAALEFAEAGLRPVVIERGAPVEQRRADVERFKLTRVLDTSSNVQFGEGGAGTFSDGKLTCGKNSPFTQRVLETFVAAGAPLEVLWQAKPHIGTDVLGGVVAAIRNRITACGGEVLFRTRLVGLEFGADAQGRKQVMAALVESAGDRMQVAVRPEGIATAANPQSMLQQRRIPASQLVLAIGHSARDTFRMLYECGVELEQKPFSMGVRIEHLQAAINLAQYGAAAEHPALGAADYKLACHLKGGRSVYTFCMCPGGEVVAAASEQGGVCVNGMSNQARDGANANAALLCNVEPADYGNPQDPLAGIAFQRRWEQAAFEAGGADWRAPLQTLGEFTGTERSGKTALTPSYPLGVNNVDLGMCLPAYATAALRDALPHFERKLHGFAEPGALLTGIEARSSSPVRIVRDRVTLESTRVGGLYPCGEGAGYAGGIMSAAIDGIRVARAAMQAGVSA